MQRYLALLRGINVGGKNIIKMADLRESFTGVGCTEVQTYIQSGNVLFSARQSSVAALSESITSTLQKNFGYKNPLFILPQQALVQVVADAPKGFGSEPDKYRYDVLFLQVGLSPKQALEQVSTKDGVDTVHAGTQALYFSRLISRATQSHLSRLIKQPVYKQITIRNWNTTSKLLEMLAGVQ